ncbi:MAG: penicillin acylase family protein, partial [Deltaproteobacteria bacterium]|nr:penicillin acylase family protein [Deltaproteobacteria bacterium]
LLPFEFAALGIMPEHRTAEDVLAWMSVLLREFDPEALNQGQLENAALIQKLTSVYGPAGYAMFEDLRWTNDPEALTYIPESTAAVESVQTLTNDALKRKANPPAGHKDLLKAAQRLSAQKADVIEKLKQINAFVKMGSYAWAVSGDKTSSSNPVLYSGPQMGFSVPSIVLEGSIAGGGLTISGMSVPGVPGIVIGRTPHHAWSMQVGHAHTVDYYIEDPSNVYLHRMETISVAGSADVTLPVFRSPHGPVINPIPYDPAGPVIAWKYSHWGYEFNNIKAYLDIARAESMDEFGEAIEGVAVSQHFCYTDNDGNIAYWMSGRDPLRPAGEWRLPQGAVPGAPVLEWDPAVLIARSTDRNTPQGYYCGWNNKSSAEYPASFNNPSYFFGPFHRAHVIDDYLSAHNDLTYEDIRDLALFIATTDSFGSGGNPWQFVADDFRSAVETAGLMDEYSGIFDLLDAWDGHFVAGGESQWRTGPDRSDAWIFMDAWIREVLELTFADELTLPGETAPYRTYDAEHKNRLFNVLLHGLAGTASGIVNLYPWYSPYSSYEEIIVTALDNVLVLYPLDETPWGTGARGTIDYRHDFLGLIHQAPLSSRSTYAHCVEFGPFGPERIESMFPLGESGTILVGPGGAPLFDINFFSMTPVFDPFMPRDFPVFEQ